MINGLIKWVTQGKLLNVRSKKLILHKLFLNCCEKSLKNWLIKKLKKNSHGNDGKWEKREKLEKSKNWMNWTIYFKKWIGKLGEQWTSSRGAPERSGSCRKPKLLVPSRLYEVTRECREFQKKNIHRQGCLVNFKKWIWKLGERVAEKSQKEAVLAGNRNF